MPLGGLIDLPHCSLYFLSGELYSQRDAGRKSQRPYVTSPSNIDLSATSSMLIPHSNCRSSCGARGARARCARVDRCAARTRRIILLSRVFENFDEFRPPKLRMRSRFLCGIENLMLDRPPPPPTHLRRPNTIDRPPLLSTTDPTPRESITTGISSGPKMKGASRKMLLKSLDLQI